VSASCAWFWCKEQSQVYYLLAVFFTSIVPWAGVLGVADTTHLCRVPMH
jgi:hypothetical protein